MAQAMLSARLAARGVTVPVTSAGLLGGRPAAAARGDLGHGRPGHRRRRPPQPAVTADDLAAADLILGMAREHVRHAAVLLPEAWPRAFTLRELLRRGQQAGAPRPRRAARRLAGPGRGRDRSRRDLLGRGPADDVADPTGGPLRGLPGHRGPARPAHPRPRRAGWLSGGSRPVARAVRDKDF